MADRNMEKIKKMKIYKIDVSKKTDGFDRLYSILEEKAKYAICPGTFIAMADDEFADKLGDESNISISEVTDVQTEIEEGYIKDWLMQEYVKLLHKEAEAEVKERTVAMYETLKQVEEYFKKKESAGHEQNAEQTESTAQEGDGSN